MAKKKRTPPSPEKASPRGAILRRKSNRSRPTRQTVPDFFPVVGVGASAGGLEPLTAFLKALSPLLGMAVVIIQHLDPRHESALTQLLSRATTLPVREAIDGIAVEPNHVYVIPPDKVMTIRGRSLWLIPRDKSRVASHTIDEFLTSLARDRKSAGIGIVLSGSGTDGTLGLKAIKEGGGLTFAQDPKTAAWTAMPASAILAGAVDFVLAPAAIAFELTRISRHPDLLEHAEPTGGNGLDSIYMLLRAATAVDFHLYKQPTIKRRIACRMALKKMASVGDYAGFLKQNPAEVKALAEDIFIHVTGFFRDPQCFQALQKLVLPKLHLNGRSDPVRVWVPGCSTGEEVYSLAMLLLEALGENPNQTQVQIFGTDIAEPAIERARAGVYSEAAVRGVSPARLGRFFLKVAHGYQINQAVRGLCIFARQNLASDPPFSKLDLVSCRNTLIYAGPDLQDRMLSAFHYALKPGGFLFLGKSESTSAYSAAFTTEDRNHKIFSRKQDSGRLPGFHWRMDDHKPIEIIPPLASPTLAPDLRKRSEQVLFERSAAPALVIDPDFRILHLEGDLSPYLTLPTGPPTVQLFKMLRLELIVDLRKTASEVLRERAAANTRPIHFEERGRPGSVRLEISPLSKADGGRPNLLVVFKATRRVPHGGQTQSEVRRHRETSLGRELAATQKYLAAVIAKHETVQDEMEAAYEEVLSSSEELESTNEELETAKEKLESSNEKLLALNEELLQRNLDLSTVTKDLNNVLAGVAIPVLVLDGSLRIRRFTPMAGKLLNLIESDIGRPFHDMAPALEVPDWDALFAEVTGQVHPVEREVRDKNGRWLSLRIRPYRTTENKIEGVIVILFDTDFIQRELVESRDYARMLLESAEQAIVAAGPNSQIELVNGAAERMFGYGRADLLGKPFEQLLFGQGQGRRADGSIFPVEVQLSTVDQSGQKLQVAFMTDNTERRRMETEIRALTAQLMNAQEEERRRVSRELHDGLCQQLASLALEVENLAVSIPVAAARARLQALGVRAVKASEEARHIAYELHPSVLDDLGLTASLKALCSEFSRAAKVNVRFRAGKLPDVIPQRIASGLYRIAEESLRNIAKHAQAKHLTVAWGKSENALMLSLEDDGAGFSPEAVRGKGGLGLVSISERTRILGGALSIESKPGRGTRISVTVPLPETGP